MSKQNSKKPAGAVEELDEALEALPDDETNGDAAAEESPLTPNDNPLEHVDVSGTTSFESAEFAAEYVGRAPGVEEEHEEGAVVIHDADAEDRAEELARRREEAQAAGEGDASEDEVAPGGQPRELAELMSVCEALIFVSDEPLPLKALADLLGEEKGWVRVAVEALAKEFNERGGGLMLRELAGGWQFATRPEHHEHIRAYLKSKPSAKLSIAALETLAVIAYKQPVTVPEILEIRGVQSSSAIKTLLDKRLIIAKGRKETVGRPMMYGTSKE
ncbi:MAG: SMC-Scp complex subunit ScpB, partial [Acidobacteriota bacterium]|nr:SMC-Scp complex subunit ScpB [Acidobacteriota bacterium]